MQYAAQGSQPDEGFSLDAKLIKVFEIYCNLRQKKGQRIFRVGGEDIKSIVLPV